ncbi:MAG TPA: hypothetical protein DEB06_09675, partial [Phycisphaerales bacterium]|nr:hypothetical protein [Phycisphaerales bacterium]
AGAGGGATPDEVRAIASEVLADAQTRSSLLASGGLAGHDGRFFLASGDGNFRLNIGGQIQFRYTTNFRSDDDDAPNSDDFESGFSDPRTRVYFDGHAHDPRLFYRVMLDFRAAGGDGFLQDAWAGYRFENGLTLRGGEGITAFMREWFMGDFKLFTVERSLQALVFGQFRSKFIDLKYQTDDAPVRVIGTFSDGFRSTNTEFDADPADWALTGRAEWKFAGSWTQLENEYRSPRGSDFAGALGGAVHIEQGPSRVAGPGGVAEQTLLAWTADLLLKGDGWNAMLAGVGYHTEDEAGVSGADFDDFSALAQGGVHVTDDVELIGRYEVIIPDGDRAGDDPLNAVTAGFNWYLHGQAAKFSFAGILFLDDTNGTTAGNFGNTGPRTPTSPAFGSLPSTEAGQVTVWAQFQLLF